MPIPPYVRLVSQRAKGDCGLAALAMYFGLSYEEVFCAAHCRKRDRDVRETGMYTKDFLRIAKRLGRVLLLRRKVDLDEDTGILTIERTEPQEECFLQHVVLLRFGLIFDTDGMIWEPQDYMDMLNFRPLSLLTEDNA